MPPTASASATGDRNIPGADRDSAAPTAATAGEVYKISESHFAYGRRCGHRGDCCRTLVLAPDNVVVVVRVAEEEGGVCGVIVLAGCHERLGWMCLMFSALNGDEKVEHSLLHRARSGRVENGGAVEVDIDVHTLFVQLADRLLLLVAQPRFLSHQRSDCRHSFGS